MLEYEFHIGKNQQFLFQIGNQLFYNFTNFSNNKLSIIYHYNN